MAKLDDIRSEIEQLQTLPQDTLVAKAESVYRMLSDMTKQLEKDVEKGLAWTYPEATEIVCSMLDNYRLFEHVAPMITISREDYARVINLAAVNLAYNRPQDAIGLFEEGIERLKGPNTIEEKYYLAILKREYKNLIGRLRRKSDNINEEAIAYMKKWSKKHGKQH